MPVFARTKIVLQEDCYREKPERMQIKYVGPNAIKLYHKSYDLIKAVFRASDTDLQEEKYNWGKGDKEKFSVRWFLHKDMDVYTYIYIRFDVSGSGDEKSGNATIKVKPVIRSLFYEMMRTFWHRFYYHKKRQDYAEECRHGVIMFQRQMNEFFRELRGE